MKKTHRPVLATAVLLATIVACAFPLQQSQDAGLPSNQVLTMVPATSPVPAPTSNGGTATEASGILLPSTFYYLADGSNGGVQVFRMERDGKTVTQLTHEPDSVMGYDVSLVDGSVAYLSNNQLLLINANDSNRRVVVDGGPRDENNPAVFKEPTSSPVFSPDGQRLAYGYRGLNLYDVSTGVSNLLIDNQYGEPLPSGLPFPIELYSPDRYSPDGKKLLVSLGHWEHVPSTGIYDVARKALVRYTEMEGDIYCCSFYGGAEWSPDSSSFYAVASAHDYSYASGALWRVDAATGAVTTLMPGGSGEGASFKLNLPYGPYLAPSGRLYYFFVSYPEPSGNVEPPRLQLVCSGPDGVTGRFCGPILLN